MAIHHGILLRIRDRDRPVSVVNLNGSTELELRRLLRCLHRRHLLARALASVLALLRLLLVLDDCRLCLWHDDLLVLVTLDNSGR